MTEELESASQRTLAQPRNPRLNVEVSGMPLAMPRSPRTVRPAFLIVLAFVLLIAALSHVHVVRTPPISTPAPTPTPEPSPHFALDDVNLGPHIGLTRFTPDFDIYPGQAVEGADGNLYVAYDPGRGPDHWGFTGGEPIAVGILHAGRIREIFSTGGIYLQMEGLKDGMPLISIPDPVRPTKNLYVQVSASGIRRLPRGYESSQQWYSPCIPFDGGKMCDGNDNVPFTTRDGRTIIIAGEHYAYEWGAITAYTTDGVRLIGGGRHHFLLVEYQNMRSVAECLGGICSLESAAV